MRPCSKLKGQERAEKVYPFDGQLYAQALRPEIYLVILEPGWKFGRGSFSCVRYCLADNPSSPGPVVDETRRDQGGRVLSRYAYILKL